MCCSANSTLTFMVLYLLLYLVVVSTPPDVRILTSEVKGFFRVISKSLLVSFSTAVTSYHCVDTLSFLNRTNNCLYFHQHT